MSSYLNSSTNYAIYSLPVAWITAIAPHWYAIGLSTTKGFPKGQFNNCSPREFLVSIACKEKKTRAEKAYIRAESANANGFENLPLYAAAIAVGSLAKVEAPTLNRLAAAYILSRWVYNILYIRFNHPALSIVRTGSYFAGITILAAIFAKAGQKLNGTA